MLAVVAAILLGPAAVTPYVDRRVGFQVTVPEDQWKQVPLVDTPAEVVLLYANDATDQLLVVSKIAGPSENAEKDPDLLSGVENGIKAKSKGYQRLSAKKRMLPQGRLKITAYDLYFQVDREGKQVTMGARFLFFRGYALSILVDSPDGGKPSKAMKKIVESFVPPPPLK